MLQSSVVVLIVASLARAAAQEPPPSPSDGASSGGDDGPETLSSSHLAKEEGYDFVVVGGGMGGLVAARRLMEANYSVLVLEAGGNGALDLGRIPLAVTVSAFDRRINWLYPTTPDGVSFSDGVAKVSAGRGLGGSSQIHGEVTVRGDRNDYDSVWARTIGPDTPFAAARFFEEYPRLLRQTNASLVAEFPDWFSAERGGVLDEVVTVNEAQAGLQELLVEAGKEKGLNYQRVGAGGDTEDIVGNFQSTHNVDTGERQTNYEFVRPFRRSPLFDYSLDSVVNKLVFASGGTAAGLTATGVEYFKRLEDGNRWIKKYVRPSKGVVLSAGTVGTSLVLLRSGIGDRAHLEAMNVSVVKHLPKVGKPLAQIGSVAAMYRLPSSRPWGFVQSFLGSPRLRWFFDLFRWAENRGWYATSPYTMFFNTRTSTAKAAGFRSPDGNVALMSLDALSLMLGQHIPPTSETVRFLLTGAGVTPGISNIFTLSANLNFVSSEGDIQLSSRDAIVLVNGSERVDFWTVTNDGTYATGTVPDGSSRLETSAAFEVAPPMYYPYHLNTRWDRKRIVDMIRYTMSFGATSAFKEKDVQLIDMSQHPTCAIQPGAGAFTKQHVGQKIYFVSSAEVMMYNGRRLTLFGNELPACDKSPCAYEIASVDGGVGGTVTLNAVVAQNLASDGDNAINDSLDPESNIVGKITIRNPGSDKFFECLAKELPFQLYHETSANRMGLREETSVIDTQCRVHTSDNVWVADASGFPNQITGNPGTPTMAFASICMKGVISQQMKK